MPSRITSDEAVASAAQGLLVCRGISKRFPGVLALDRVELELRQGEVHVLVGQNGAGKSSLVKILCGVHTPDAGWMQYCGQRYAPRSALEAIRAGVRVVFQEFNLLPYLSVAENVFFHKLPRRAGIVDFKRLERETAALLAEVGLDVSPRARVETLGVAQMQLVEIAKALSTQSNVLILDEPTATLTPREIGRLFQIIGRLRARGGTIVYISHRLQEVFDIGDRITVLRNGRTISTADVRSSSIPQLVRLMIGREMGEEYPFRPEVQLGPELLRVEALRRCASPHAVSFSLCAGEIVGVAGLVGAGRTESMRALFGADPKRGGRILRRGQRVDIRCPRDAVRHGICLLTEDRKTQGLVLDMSCAVNATLAHLSRISRLGLLRPERERAAAEELIVELDIKTPSIRQLARNLSGGNQQKLVIAKWLFRRAEVLIFDEPTRGIDVGARHEIYLLLWRLAAEGKGIVLVSSDLPELMGLCHRILVFSNGRITGDVPRAAFTQERILTLAYQEYIHRSGAPEDALARSEGL